MSGESRYEQDDKAAFWRADERGTLSSEGGFLKLVDRFFPGASGHFPHGRGDDCAELTNLPASLALSTDMFLEDSHFSRTYFSPAETGAKALSAAVSDLAAAGAVPLGFSLGLALPAATSVRAVEGMLAGMAEAADKYGIVLTGGDVSKSDRVVFSLCVWGRSVHEDGLFLRRGGALPGDSIFLVGEAGLSRVGLWALQAYGKDAISDWPEACAAHLNPQPLLQEGTALASLLFNGGERGQNGISLMDVSDGIARDLPRLLGRLGAELDIPEAHIPAEVVKAATPMGVPAVDIFLQGGEDYALLGTCSPDLLPALRERVPGAVLLGRVTPEQGIIRQGGQPLPEGFDHFDAASGCRESSSPTLKNSLIFQGGYASPEVTAFPANGEVFSAGQNVFSATSEVLPECPASFLPEQDRAKASSPGNLQVAVDALIRLGRQAYAAGLMAGFNGNISCRVPGSGTTGDCLVITRSGCAKGRLEQRDFLALALPDGGLLPHLLPEAPTAASSESPLHVAVYNTCPESRVILHVHPPRLLALSLLVDAYDLLRMPLPESERYCAAMGVVPFYPPGSGELGWAVGESAKTHKAVWMIRHGLVAHGPDMTGVLALCEELEQLAVVQLALLGKKIIA